MKDHVLNPEYSRYRDGQINLVTFQNKFRHHRRKTHGNVLKNQTTWFWTNKSSSFAARFRGISRLGSAFTTLRWFKLVHICFQVTGPTKGDEVKSISKIFCRKSISWDTTYSPSLNLEAKLTGKCCKAKVRAEKANKLKTKMNKSEQKVRKVKKWKIHRSYKRTERPSDANCVAEL